MKKLIDRAPFCPIGVKSNTRITVTAFIKMCKRHQSLAAGSVKGYDGASTVHASACAVCRVGPRIIRNEDPVLVVKDIEWIFIDEVLAIQNRLHNVVVTVSKAVKSYNQRKGNKGMRANLLKLQSLLKRAEIILSEMLQDNAAPFVVAVDEPVAPVQKEVKAEVKAEIKEPKKAKETPVVTSKVSSKKKIGERAIALSKELYEQEQSGSSRVFLSTKYKLSKKYIGTLVRHYAQSLSDK